MDQPSAFEVQYPLSPRKFWKKILGTVSAYFIIGVFCIACIIFIVSIGGNIGTTGDTTQFIQTITLAIGAFLLIYLVYVLRLVYNSLY